MKVLRSRRFAASHEPKVGDPVAGRWRRQAGDATGRNRPCAPPPRSRSIRHSDELDWGTESLKSSAFGRAHG